LRVRLLCEYQRFQLVQEQIQALEAERRERIRSSTQPEAEQVRRLLRLRGIGINCAWLYVMEFFCWRAFRNRREVEALAGLTPMPHQSGEEDRELGISKVGNRHIRAMAIEIAWIWLRYQPHSELSLWYQRRFAKGSKRLRKIGIVALARKLLIAIWRYLEFGTVPTGAVLKSTCSDWQPSFSSLQRSLPGWCELPVLPPGFPLEPPVRWGCSPSASPTLLNV
jgi:transposase